MADYVRGSFCFPAKNWVHLTVPWLARVLNKPFIAATATRLMFCQDLISSL